MSFPLGAQHHELVNSNEPSLESDIPSIQSAVSETSKHLSFLDSEILGLRKRLKRLEEEHAAVHTYRMQNIIILSPLRRMPSEVLGNFFLCTLPLAGDAMDQGMFDVGSSPWVLTHISDHWRALAISNPALWSPIAINYSLSSRYPLPLLDTQITRARSLKIHFYGSEEFDSRPQITVFRFLAEHCFLWEELVISLTSDLVPILDTLRDCVPSLRRLRIKWDDVKSLAAVQSTNAFRTAPALLDVGIYNQYRLAPIFFPMWQLTRYQFDGPWEIHQNTLSMAQNLVEVHINICFEEGPWPEADTIIALPHLQRLYVSDIGVLNYIRTPALQELACYTYNEPHLLLHLKSFLVCSACNLRRLCFRGPPDSQHVIEILQKHPFITELAIITSDPEAELDALHEATNTLISRLTVSNSGEGMVVSPQLSAIDFGCKDVTCIDHALYLEMLKSRWSAEDCALKSSTLVADFGPGPDGLTLDGLHSLRQDGLDLTLLHGTRGSEVMDD
ncbi:hypothetical protein B0H17DRAFT_1124812 [Mycena rosella]|uniref:F-box domain-containing protein n=1 Tax=Mycena rosella TaxID=1033263 RepID=A0AAD7GZW4_MYCRO|nr:hypothetical protein B0H17DRAFT_1124812 [Mycena rosella]